MSRDRASAYAQAVKQGAPHAQQIADRWHLLANLRETIMAFLKRKQSSLPRELAEKADHLSEEPLAGLVPETESEDALPERPCIEPEPMLERERDITAFQRDSAREKQFHAPNQHMLAQQQVSRARRLAVFEEVRSLSQQGLSIRTIARSLGLSRQRIRRYLQVESLPEAPPRPRSPVKSKLDPFVSYLLKRWNEGEFNGTQLYREIREQGYTGSRPLVGLLVADLRRILPPAEGSPRTWRRKGVPRASLKMSSPKRFVRPSPKRRLTPKAGLLVVHAPT